MNEFWLDQQKSCQQGVSRDEGTAEEGTHKHNKKPDCGQRVMRKEELIRKDDTAWQLT